MSQSKTEFFVQAAPGVIPPYSDPDEPGEDGSFIYPYIQVRLAQYEGAIFSERTLALLDTGSQYTLFPESYIKQLGIDARTPQEINTVNGPIKVKFGPARIQIDDLDPIDLEWVGFYAGQHVILGLPQMLIHYDIRLSFTEDAIELTER